MPLLFFPDVVVAYDFPNTAAIGSVRENWKHVDFYFLDVWPVSFKIPTRLSPPLSTHPRPDSTGETSTMNRRLSSSESDVDRQVSSWSAHCLTFVPTVERNRSSRRDGLKSQIAETQGMGFSENTAPFLCSAMMSCSACWQKIGGMAPRGRQGTVDSLRRSTVE